MPWIRLEARCLPVAVILACTWAVTACADNTTGAEVEGIARFAGTWQCKQFSITHNEHPGVVIDLVGNGGAVQMSIQASGTFSGTATIPGVILGDPEMGPVTVPISGVLRDLGTDRVRFDFIPEIPPVFTTMDTEYAFIGNTLTLEDQESVFDFNGDGTGEPGTFSGHFTRS